MREQDRIERMERIRASACQGLVTADQIAARECVSPRTIYRDVQRMRRAGVQIEGEAGLGYIIRKAAQ